MVSIGRVLGGGEMGRQDESHSSVQEFHRSNLLHALDLWVTCLRRCGLGYIGGGIA